MSSTLRELDNFPTAYRTIELLLGLFCEMYGPLLIPFQGIVTQILVIELYTLIRHILEPTVIVGLSFSSGTLLAFMTAYLTVGGIICKESKIGNLAHLRTGLITEYIYCRCAANLVQIDQTVILLAVRQT
jgi:hypothetical protein